MKQQRIREWFQKAWRKAQPFLVAQLPHTDEEAAIVFTFALCLFVYFSSPPEKPSVPPDNPPAPEQIVHKPVGVPALVLTQVEPASEQDEDELEDEETLEEEEKDDDPLLLHSSLFPDETEEDDLLAGREDKDELNLTRLLPEDDDLSKEDPW